MLKAELAGKLPSDVDREDLLTSEVFGALVYADAWVCLAAWLGVARNLDWVRLGDRLPQSATSAEVLFWPRMPSVSSTREPDALVLFRQGEHPSHAVVLEAKLSSGTSDWEIDTPTDASTESGLQLVDQLEALREHRVRTRTGDLVALPPADRCSLVCLTADVLMPEGVLQDSVKLLDQRSRGATSSRGAVYWLNWQSLVAPLDAATRTAASAGQGRLLADLRELLERRELHAPPFAGFDGLPPRPSSGPGLTWFESLAGGKKFNGFAGLPAGPGTGGLSWWTGGSE